MVLPLLIGLAAVGIVGYAFTQTSAADNISEAVKNFSTTKEQESHEIYLENKKSDRQTLLDDRGFFYNGLAFLLGDARVNKALGYNVEGTPVKTGLVKGTTKPSAGRNG